jgi:hypothetical protein
MLNEIEILDDYKPRWYQIEFEKAMFSGYRRAFLLYHRRAGKDYSCWMLTIYAACRDVPGIYYYILPTYNQGRKVIWDGMDESGKRFLDYVPKQFIEGQPNSSEMKIRLKNGSLIQIVGSDNPDAIRGTNPKGVVLSEYAMQDPRIWSEILSPILLKNGGWAVFNTTPMGKNHAWKLWDDMRDSKTWFRQKLTIEDTGLITQEQIDQERAEGRSEEIIQQEYYCSFARGTEGAYYARIMGKMDDEGRICRVGYDPCALVNTAWDCGFGDSTSIIWYQVIGTEVRIIDYYESQGEGLAHYVRVIQSKGFAYGQHFLPHDAAAGHFQTGMTGINKLWELGLKGIALPREDFDVGIEETRSMLSHCYIDKDKCKVLIQCLQSYHKKFNDKMQIYSDTPQHDWSSHAADATRYLAMALKLYGKGVGSLTKDKIDEMRRKAYGY